MMRTKEIEKAAKTVYIVADMITFGTCFDGNVVENKKVKIFKFNKRF